MSTALAVCHGPFGRVTVYRLDKPMRTHAHREGHLTFLLAGPPAIVTVSNIAYPMDEAMGVAINPWQPHSFQPCSTEKPSVYLVAYICDRWLDRDQEGRGSLRFGSNAIRVGTTLRSISDIVQHQRLLDNNEQSATPKAMLEELAADSRCLTKLMRAAHEVCDEFKDVATASLLEVWIDEAERRTWFLYETVRGRN